MRQSLLRSLLYGVSILVVMTKVPLTGDPKIVAGTDTLGGSSRLTGA